MQSALVTLKVKENMFINLKVEKDMFAKKWGMCVYLRRDATTEVK